MDSEIIISINLPGRLSTMLEHKTYQKQSLTFIDDKGKIELVTCNILHTDRIPSICVREIQISPVTVKHWVDGPCPYWSAMKVWKKLGRDQKIRMYVDTFDEGYGVSFT